MSRGFPSMTALLGLLAVAGYQNRDKIAEMLRGMGQSSPGSAGQSGLGGLLDRLKGSLGGEAGAGGLLSGGLGELVDRFKQTGHGDTADSWVGTGPNKQVTPSQLEQAIKRGYRAKSYWQGSHASFPTRLTNIRRRAGCLRRRFRALVTRRQEPWRLPPQSPCTVSDERRVARTLRGRRSAESLRTSCDD